MSLAKPDDIVAALKDYGCRVHEWPGWRTRGRPYSFNPYGQAWHHDAFRETYGDLEAAAYMTERGRPDLPPPLCNGAIGNYGTVFLCAYGNANHAGKNRASVHELLRAGRAPYGWARDRPYEPDTVVGNSRLWGWECRNAGTGHDPWEQLDIMVRAGAATADCCGWSAEASAAHGELTSRKIDPVGFQMDWFRFSIALTMLDQHRPAQEGEEMEHAIIALYNIARGTKERPYNVLMEEPMGFIHWQKVGEAAGANWRKKFNETLVPGLRRERPGRNIPTL